MKSDSPQGLLRTLNIECAQLSARMRKGLVRRIDDLERAMNDPLVGARDRAAAAEEYRATLKDMQEAMVKTAPYLMARGNAPDTTAIPTAQEVMDEIVKGKKR